MFPEANKASTAPGAAATTSAPTPASGGPAPPGAAPQPPKRGRPFGSLNRNTSAPRLTETTVSADGAQPAPDAEPQRRRRRMKAIDKSQLAKQLIGIHTIAAKLTQMPFVAIDQTEADMLADAIDNVAREYDLALDGKTGAFIQLMAAAAVVYGPRVMMYQAIQRRSRREAGQTVEGTATPIDQGANGATASSAAT